MRIGPLPAADQMGTQIQQTLLSTMELADVPGLRVVFDAVGVDAETIAVFFAALPDGRPIVNIVVGAREVGSGSVLAAGARYFSERVPSGRTRVAGQAVDAPLADRITVHEIKVSQRLGGRALARRGRRRDRGSALRRASAPALASSSTSWLIARPESTRHG